MIGSASSQSLCFILSLRLSRFITSRPDLCIPLYFNLLFTKKKNILGTTRLHDQYDSIATTFYLLQVCEINFRYVTRVYRVCGQVRLYLVCSDTATIYNLDILATASLAIVLYGEQTTKFARASLVDH